jgi:hypothetical protein
MPSFPSLSLYANALWTPSMAMFSPAKGGSASRTSFAKAVAKQSSATSSAASSAAFSSAVARRATATATAASTSISSEHPSAAESNVVGGAVPHFSNDRHAFDAEFDAWMTKATLRDVLGSGGSGSSNGADLLPEAAEASPQTASWATSAVKSFKEFVPRLAASSGAEAASTPAPRYPAASLSHQLSQYNQHQFQYYQQLAQWNASVQLMPQPLPVQVMQMPMSLSTGFSVQSLVYHASPHSRCVYFQAPAAPAMAPHFGSNLVPHQQK